MEADTPEIELERFAALCAEVEEGTPLEAVLRAAGLSEQAWSASRDAWMGRMSSGSDDERVSLEGRYRAAFDARQRALRPPPSDGSDGGDGSEPITQEKPRAAEAQPPTEPEPATTRMADDDPPTPRAPRTSRRRLNTLPIVDEQSWSGVGPMPQPSGAEVPLDDRLTPAAPFAAPSRRPSQPDGALPFRPPASEGERATVAPPPSGVEDRLPGGLPFRPPSSTPAGSAVPSSAPLPFRPPLESDHAAPVSSAMAQPQSQPQPQLQPQPQPQPQLQPAAFPQMPFPPPPPGAAPFRPPAVAMSAPAGPQGPSLSYGSYPPAPAGAPGAAPPGFGRPPSPPNTSPASSPSPLSLAGFAAMASGPRLGLEQYAAFEAEIAVNPASMAEIRARYGLTDATHPAESEAWQRRFAADRELYVRYANLFQRYRDWLSSQKER